MEIAEHITAVEQEGKLLAAAAGEGGLDVQIPTCPGWDMRELLRHLSEIHLWAAGIVSQRTTKLWPDDISEHTETWPELAVFWPEDDDMIEMYLR
ncbi:MAG: maleylpyruvate isomerase N-terminal domain-containing protein, partial [Actinomycetota bacterium]